MQKNLIKKYNVPGPRYTSYPTVPYWDETPPTIEQWERSVKQSFDESNEKAGIGIYIHLPFCESLCTFCACNTRITINHEVEKPYINNLLKEWELYLNLFQTAPQIKEIHLGGGTPTFFKPEILKKLIEGITSTAKVCNNIEFGFEAHPNNTTTEHLQTLYDLGFRRLSLGIQDFDPKVQYIVNRIESFEVVKKVTDTARKIGYTSINFDLIYGLPLQTKKSIVDTINKVNLLRPDRIAFYSYAHVPWIKGVGQRKFTESDLPSGAEKRALYEIGLEMLRDNGYQEVGMDHFALKTDSLHKSSINKTLHRNFMGYTPLYTQLLIGLGVSSISDTWYGFAQNVKVVEQYSELIKKGQLPIFRGHAHTEEDLIIRKHILNIMCNYETSWESPAEQHDALYEGLERLKEIENDKLISITPHHLKVTENGKPFLRNICMALDARLWRKTTETELFSKVI